VRTDFNFLDTVRISTLATATAAMTTTMTDEENKDSNDDDDDDIPKKLNGMDTKKKKKKKNTGDNNDNTMDTIKSHSNNIEDWIPTCLALFFIGILRLTPVLYALSNTLCIDISRSLDDLNGFGILESLDVMDFLEKSSLFLFVNLASLG
jgi:hypothetical protein